MLKSDNINELAQALAKSQGKFAAIKKTSKVDYTSAKGRTHYNYAPLDAVLDATRKALSDEGLSVLQLVSAAKEGIFQLETVIAHSSGQWISSSMDVKAYPDNPQSQGSALTYARRYALSALLNVASEEDDDGETGEGKQTDKKKEAPPSPNPTPEQHFCKEHNTPFVRHEKDGKVWWSHKNGDSWCNEAKGTAEEVERELGVDPPEPNLITEAQIAIITELAKTVPLSITGRELWPESKASLTLQNLPKLPYKGAIILIQAMRKKAGTNA